jgi:heterokaryon incompatibility protein (HET)
MRLLECQSSGEFQLTKFFYESDIPRYAILSHTWGPDDEEVTFDDLARQASKRKTGYNKIRFCGEQAAKDGLNYFWIDTCCIDKANNTELSQAINSMFKWYSNSVKCYVYLSDVSIGKDGIQQLESTWIPAFRKSRWFTRGWTLQELLAPASVEFFSSEGRLIGDKFSLKNYVHEITGIPLQALDRQPLSEFTIDERMSWAKTRNTKVKEDGIYCLFGIFGIYMPLIYGEGIENASRRFMLEIKSASISSLLFLL